MKDLVDGHSKKVGMTAVVGETTKDQPHFMVPFPRNKDFIGESHITSWFKIEAGKSERTGHLRLALCGLGGIGITQFEADYRKLGPFAKIPGHDDSKQNIGLIVKEWLEGPQSGEWILVIDNADNKLYFYPEPKSTESKESNTISIAHHGIAKFIPRGSKGTIIVTTRDREVARNLANQNVIIKPELDPEQAIELFYQNYSNAQCTSPDTTALPRLLRELQCLPLAIVQVVKRLLSKPHHNIWRDNNENAETILTTFSISFRQLQQQSKLADSFLRFMACIDRNAVPRDLLFQIHMNGVEDELLISEALDKLVNFSILQNSKIDFGSGQGYEIHSLVHLTMQTYLGSGEMNNALAKASTVLAAALPDFSKYENWGAWRVYLPHAVALLANLIKEKVLEVRRRILGEDHPDTLIVMQNLAATYAELGGRLKEVQELEEKVLEARKRTLGE
ncbi:hypothetical protein FPQ18DRAFT_417189 [Pyronema domesticum]|nr:hypothetical protein FPQ18DRAFT_417189 [Pyronema domesticum]